MAGAELATLLAQLDACQCRVALFAADPSAVSQEELSRLSDELADLAAELRSWSDTAQRRSPTPSTLRSLLSLARADLASQLADDATPAEHLERIVQLAQGLVPGTEHAGVSTVKGDVVATIAATSSVVSEVDRIQGELGMGPVFQVSAVHEVVRVDDLGNDARWPKYAAQVQELRVRSVLVCELPMTHGTPSVLSLYAGRRRAFSTSAELVVPVFAARAAIALAHADEVSNLHRAIDSRQVIGEAAGILMERHRLGSEQAFARLIGASQHRHIKLRDLAVRITETGEDPESVTM
ncbi:MAG TPA: ANTAR domain-containing protein [Jatrophihabitans sp.]|nr:ANTAR domain-containing protein [Jatrophihabitans sp.]